MNVARAAGDLAVRPRAVAIGTFDGVHLGHRAVVRAAVDAARSGELVPTVVTFHPHPRTVLAKRVELLATLERRLELLATAGVEEMLVVEFSPEIAGLEPEEFARQYLLAIGAQVVVAGTGFRFGKRRAGDLELLRGLGLDARQVPLVEGVSSTRIRQLAHAGDVEGAARLLGRPLEVEGTVIGGDQRGGTLGFPTANLAVDPDLLVPGFGIYAGPPASAGRRSRSASTHTTAARSAASRRYLLDWTGDLYGRPDRGRALAAAARRAGLRERGRAGRPDRAGATSRRPERRSPARLE